MKFQEFYHGIVVFRSKADLKWVFLLTRIEERVENQVVGSAEFREVTAFSGTSIDESRPGVEPRLGKREFAIANVRDGEETLFVLRSRAET